jgi:polysaccharide deacetylase 2 family uncharacterized protein YibQ
MPSDELTRPLGLIPARRRFRPRAAWLAAIALVAAGAIAGGTWLVRGDGTPSVTAAIANAPGKPSVDVAVRTGTVAEAPPQAPIVTAGPGLTAVAPPTGALTDVGKVRIYDPSQPLAIALPATPDPALVENGAYGPLPKIAANGVRPLDAYARPAASAAGGPRIAIVVGGVGIDPATSRDAITLLPGAVTLAVAPYAIDLKQTMADARAVGHEILLQIPLEPYGYPKSDPGPHTLTATASAKANLDDLSWLLSRATNYVGVINYMGAAFTNAPQPMTTLLDAVGRRGLLYLDDGSSPRSLAADLAGRTPFLRADLVLDPDLTPGAIDARLDQLVTIARQRGYAVATATAFPATIERIAIFARAAASRDVTLVPVSALVAAAPRT